MLQKLLCALCGLLFCVHDFAARGVSHEDLLFESCRGRLCYRHRLKKQRQISPAYVHINNIIMCAPNRDR